MRDVTGVEAVQQDVGGNDPETGVAAERWTYLGPAGTFTEQAALSMVTRRSGTERDVVLDPVDSVSIALSAVRSGAADAACVALESSVEGTVPVTQDELTHGEPLLIAAEAYVPVTFDLLVRPGTELSSIATVGAHPHGQAQIRSWLAANLPQARAVMSTSNAAAAASVAAGELDAAAAAPLAGPKYGLITLAADIGEIRDAVTRFVLLRRPGRPPRPTGNDRTSLVLSVGNHPGSLMAVLEEFASRGINLTRLESRPARSKMGIYVFIVDADGHLDDPSMADVIGGLIRRSALQRWLGSYPRMSGTNDPSADFATAEAYAAADEQVGRWQRGEWD